jgi:hypothetical protein
MNNNSLLGPWIRRFLLEHLVGERSPEHIAWLNHIRSIPFKKTSKPSITYLEKHEMDIAQYSQS